MACDRPAWFLEGRRGGALGFLQTALSTLAFVTMYCLCLLGPTGKIAKVRRFWANTDEGAAAMAREMLSDDPTLIGFQLWDGPRQIAEERKRTGAAPRGSKRAHTRRSREGRT